MVLRIKVKLIMGKLKSKKENKKKYPAAQKILGLFIKNDVSL